MHFESQHIIWFFWILPLLFLVFLFVQYWRSQILSSLFVRTSWRTRMSEVVLWTYWLRFAFFAVALASLIIAWMKPYSDFEMREVTNKGVDLFFAVDLSASMKAQDVQPSRISRARREIMDFLVRMTGDRVGMIGFAGESYVFVPLTSDYAAVDLFINELDPGSIPIPGTDIQGAIKKAVATFSKQSQATGKAVILITDGEDSFGLDEDLIRTIKKYDIKIFVIGIGTAEGAPIPLDGGGYKTDQDGKVVITKLNEDALKSLALSTGGGYARSVTGDLDLEQIYFQGIKKSLENSELKTKQRRIPVYEFQKFILAALVMLFLEILWTNRRWYWLGKILFWRKSNSSKTSTSSTRQIMLTLAVFAGLLSAPAQAMLNPFDWDKADDTYNGAQYEHALKKYLDLAVKDPQNTEIQYNLGNTYYQLKKYDEAIKSYQKSLNSENVTLRKYALFNMGNALYRKEKLEDAIKSYEMALGIDSGFKPAELNRDFVKKKQEEKQQQDQQKQDEKKDEENQNNQNQNQNQSDNQSQNQDSQQQGNKSQDEKQQDNENQDQSKQNEQDQKNDQQKDSEDQNQSDSEQKNDQNDQKPEEEQGDQNQDNQSEDESKSDEENKENQDDKQSDGSGDEEQQQDQEPKDEEQQADGDKEEQQQQDQGADSGNTEEQQGDETEQKQMQQFKFDAQPNKWLDSISDEPGKVLRRMILQQTNPPENKIPNDW